MLYFWGISKVSFEVLCIDPVVAAAAAADASDGCFLLLMNFVFVLVRGVLCSPFVLNSSELSCGLSHWMDRWLFILQTCALTSPSILPHPVQRPFAVKFPQCIERKEEHNLCAVVWVSLSHFFLFFLSLFDRNSFRESSPRRHLSPIIVQTSSPSPIILACVRRVAICQVCSLWTNVCREISKFRTGISWQ